MVKKIVLDTNFLLIPARFKVDVFAELRRVLDVDYEVYFPDVCWNELESLAKGKSRHAREAKIGLELAKSKGVKTLVTGQKGHADDIILRLAEKERFITATQDLTLAKRLRSKGLISIVLRNKSHLEVV